MNRQTLGAMALAVALGFLLDSASIPLGWLIGAAIATAGGALSGYKIIISPYLQRTGLVVLATSTGLLVAPGSFNTLVAWLPVILVSVLISMTLVFAVTHLYAKLAGVDRPTAFFSLLPGGVVEMAGFGERYGANHTIISTLHAFRVALIVLLLPVLVGFFTSATDQSSFSPVQATILNPLPFLYILSAGTIGGLVAHWLRLPAAWLLGPLIIVSTMSMQSFAPVGAVWPVFLVIAQILIGASLGSKFKRASIQSIPRALAVGLPVHFLLGAGSVILAVMFAKIFSPSVGTFILSTAGGGMAEMTVAAKIFGENVVLVALFHVIRALLVNVLAVPIWRHLS